MPPLQSDLMQKIISKLNRVVKSFTKRSFIVKFRLKVNFEFKSLNVIFDLNVNSIFEKNYLSKCYEQMIGNFTTFLNVYKNNLLVKLDIDQILIIDRGGKD